ncbi:MAG: amidophosphoribosyltransferase [Candidatus Fermentibacteraceae bacterium]|nr:amidophosphoribosyltransferase [Candidatus Fermentibacteraceae bacterium]MBN2607612.1 amidophosphoribosyltransferase [Candidatus Fermentibacteraceae bacterium]
MGGFFGVVSEKDCTDDVFYGTDYHSHLGTMRGGMAIKGPDGIDRAIHDITSAQFRSKFEEDLARMSGNSGIGVISDFDDQPLIIGSHLGRYAIVTVGVINNLDGIVREVFRNRSGHFSEMAWGEVSPTEVVAMLINQEDSFSAGLRRAQESIQGSCSVLLLTEKGIYASRDRLGRTPVAIGRKEGAFAVTFETCAFPNLEYRFEKELGPGEVVLLTEDGYETVKEPGGMMRICAFLWVYYGFPASNYEGVNVEDARNRCGECLARRDDVEVDMVAGVPDSGTGHAVGYANYSGIPYRRPFVKYTPTWPRSFMPQKQEMRDLVARMKLIPIRELINGKRLLFCEDSIVRGTQLKDTVKRLFDSGASEIHMRPACPPLVFGCRYLNFSRSRSVMDLAGRKAIQELEGDNESIPGAYLDPDSAEYTAMLASIRKRLGLTTLAYQRLEDLVEAIGLPGEKLCTYCFDGTE